MQGLSFRQVGQRLREEFGTSLRTGARDWTAVHDYWAELAEEPRSQAAMRGEALERLHDLVDVALKRNPPDVRTALDCVWRIMRIRGLLIPDTISQQQVTVEQAREYMVRVMEIVGEVVGDQDKMDAIIGRLEAEGNGRKPFVCNR